MSKCKVCGGKIPFAFFQSKKICKTCQQKPQRIYVQIRSNTSPPKEGFDVLSPDETAFFDAIAKKLADVPRVHRIIATRMSNGSFNVDIEQGCIGKIKLKGRKTHMLVNHNLYDYETYENLELENYINLLDDWVLYAKKYLLR